jgi:5-formyltetrahydrofolate cyclo-ligase
VSEDERIKNEKVVMRETARDAIAAFSAPARDAASRAIAGHLSGAEIWKRARCVMAYLADDSEPNLDPLLKAALATGIEICAPRMDWEARAMQPGVLDAIDLIETRRHGIREPMADAAQIPVEALDLVLVPGVAFDAAGNRLGRGAGFYDRFLATLPQSAHIVGVCFENQRVERVPTAPHDARVSMLVTEAGCYPAG